MTEAERAERGATNTTIQTILNAARTSSPPLSGGYVERQALFVAGDRSIRADALVIIARNPGAPLPEGADPWLRNIEFLRGQCRAWTIEVEQGTRDAAALTSLAASYATLHASRQPLKPLPLIVTASLEERDRTQDAWRAGWPQGAWLIATYEDMLRGQFTLYHDGVLAPRSLFGEGSLPGEEWVQ